jgi:hypothetical protein
MGVSAEQWNLPKKNEKNPIGLRPTLDYLRQITFLLSDF